jgi:hypothetical protein
MLTYSGESLATPYRDVTYYVGKLSILLEHCRQPKI